MFTKLYMNDNQPVLTTFIDWRHDDVISDVTVDLFRLELSVFQACEHYNLRSLHPMFTTPPSSLGLMKLHSMIGSQRRTNIDNTYLWQQQLLSAWCRQQLHRLAEGLRRLTRLWFHSVFLYSQACYTYTGWLPTLKSHGILEKSWNSTLPETSHGKPFLRFWPGKLLILTGKVMEKSWKIISNFL